MRASNLSEPTTAPYATNVYNAWTTVSRTTDSTHNTHRCLLDRHLSFNSCVCALLADCPWVNNCVGHRNYKHFNLFCLYLAILAIYFITVAWEHVTRVMLGRHHDMEMLVACVCAVSACIASLLFVMWNLYLTLTNQTTIEFYSACWMDRRPAGGKGAAEGGNPYNMGWRANLVSVYGPSVWRTLLLPILSEPPGDGLFWPMNRGRGYPLRSWWTVIKYEPHIHCLQHLIHIVLSAVLHSACERRADFTA